MTIVKNALGQVGARLRAARRARGWTLEQVSADVGMSASTLSRLESGKRQASLELLVPLTRRLGILLDDLVQQDVPDPRVRRPVIRRDGFVVTPLALESSSVLTYKITYSPHIAQPEPRAHDGFEWFFVLAGKIRLRLGERNLTLGRGEAAEFDTRVPHSISAAGHREASIISIFSESGMRMHTHTA